MKKTKKTRLIVAIVIIIAVLGAAASFPVFAPMSIDRDTHYVFIDNDDTADSVYAKIEPISKPYAYHAFTHIAERMGYDKNIRTGCYAVQPDMGALQTVRRFRNGQQEPILLTVPSVRTLDRLAEEVSKRLLLDEEELLDALHDQVTCQKYGLDTLTMQCLFIPNTYEIFWNVSVEKFLDRMKKESDKFWTPERLGKAKAAGMTENEVITLASIVDEETANNGEKPMVAGMYINRLKINMPLQADPTVKYALQDFSIKRIYNNMLKVNSPFNTYKNVGLPPGPIRIPSVAGIDAVLNHVHHNYIYMCAKEDFSGTHNFAVTYAEHLQNAAKYSKALNERNIK